MGEKVRDLAGSGDVAISFSPGKFVTGDVIEGAVV
jgi:hypothetical protein